MDNHARVINDAGLVFGTVDVETCPNQPFLWDSNNGVGTCPGDGGGLSGSVISTMRAGSWAAPFRGKTTV